jgi:hypothetical protein
MLDVIYERPLLRFFFSVSVPGQTEQSIGAWKLLHLSSFCFCSDETTSNRYLLITELEIRNNASEKTQIENKWAELSIKRSSDWRLFSSSVNWNKLILLVWDVTAAFLIVFKTFEYFQRCKSFLKGSILDLIISILEFKYRSWSCRYFKKLSL